MPRQQKYMIGAGLALLLVAGCQQLPPNAMVTSAQPQTADAGEAVGKNQAGEDCTFRTDNVGSLDVAAKSAYGVWCGTWRQPSGRIFEATEKRRRGAAHPARQRQPVALLSQPTRHLHRADRARQFSTTCPPCSCNAPSAMAAGRTSPSPRLTAAKPSWPTVCPRPCRRSRRRWRASPDMRSRTPRRSRPPPASSRPEPHHATLRQRRSRPLLRPDAPRRQQERQSMISPAPKTPSATRSPCSRRFSGRPIPASPCRSCIWRCSSATSSASRRRRASSRARKPCSATAPIR